MRIRLLAAAALLLAACTDDLPPTSPLSPGGASPRANTYNQPADWRGHWQSSRDLWIYDKSPEIGINIHMYEQPQERQHMDMARAAGMRLVRIPIFWAEMDPDGDGIYDPNKMAAVAARVQYAQDAQYAHPQGIELVFSVHGMWINEASVGTPLPWQRATTLEAFNQHFAAFLYDMVTAFPEVRFWQIWNEQDKSDWALPWRTYMNSSHPRDWGIAYASTMRTVYPLLKSQGKWVLLGGLATPDIEFVDGMYDGFDATGGKPYPLDIMALHGYGVNPYAADGPYTTVHTLAALMNGVGDVNRPIWITEAGTSGWHYEQVYGAPGGSSQDIADTFDQHQLGYYEALANGLYNSPITKMLPYSMITGGGEPSVTFLDGRDRRDYNLSLTRFTNPWSARPAWKWLHDRGATTRAAWDQPAETADFRVTTAGMIPSTQPFLYLDDGSLAVKNVTVNTLVPTSVPFLLPLQYQASIMGIGPTATVYNNQVAGNDTQEKYINRLRVQPLDVPTIACYQVHQSNVGDQPVSCSHWPDPWTGRADERVEQIRITVDNPVWSICYQVYARNYGWTPWACDGDWAGSRGLSRRIGAMRVRLHRR